MKSVRDFKLLTNDGFGRTEKSIHAANRGLHGRMFRVLLLCTICGVAAAEGETGYGCFEKLQLPEYPSAARFARRTGSVTAEITFNDDTRKVQIDVNGTADNLLKEYLKRVLSTAQIRQECSDSKVALTVRFELVGKESAEPYLSTILVWPETIIVRVRPPVVNVGR